MVVATCGAMLSSACGGSGAGARDAQSDSPPATKQDDGGIVIVVPDAGAAEANAPVDADEADLWNTICE